MALDQTHIRNLLKKQAILDIIVTPEQESWRRLVSYHYDKTKQCDRFKLNNGTGDHLYAIFSRDGAVLKGFDHESCFSPYQSDDEHDDNHIAADIYAQVPATLLHLLEEDTEKEEVTCCLWQLANEPNWQKAALPPVPTDCQVHTPQDGGEAYLLGYIFPSAEEWYEWASIYYELQEEAWDAAARLYETNEITRSMVLDLNPERDFDTVIDECEVKGLLP